jgi:hypothetical protein
MCSLSESVLSRDKAIEQASCGLTIAIDSTVSAGLFSIALRGFIESVALLSREFRRIRAEDISSEKTCPVAGEPNSKRMIVLREHPP